MNDWRTFVVFVLLFTGVGQACTASRAEQDVYRVVLSDESALVVVESVPQRVSASVFDLSPRQFEDAVAGLRPRLESAPKGSVTIFASPPRDFVFIPGAVRKEIRKDYAAKLQQDCLIPALNLESVRMLDSQAIKRLDKESHGDPDKFWTRFHKRFGANASLVSLSRVAFDQKMTLAVVHVSSGISAMGGSGMLYVLRRTQEGWSILRSYTTWTT